jgi:methylthioribose-1-phosphate isomerase
VRNPAFDVTRSALVDGLICEEGIVSLGSVVEAVRRSYPWIFEQSF